MVETGKRNRNDRDGDQRSQKKQSNITERKFNNVDGSGTSELVVYRILCPDGHIGSVIGKAGKLINSMRQETNSRIKVVDPFPNADLRVITIYCYVRKKDFVDNDDGNMRPLCPAQDGLLRVHSAIANAAASFGDSDKKNKVEAQILVPGSQAAIVIGKNGATIKKLRADTGANIKVNPKDPSDPKQSCAMSFDNFVMIVGDAEAVKRALYGISSIMYRFSPKEEISLDTTVPDNQGSIIIPPDVPIFPASSFYPGMEAVGPTSKTIPPLVGTSPHISDFPGYTDHASAWPAYSSAMAAASVYGGSSQSEELVVRVLCPSDKIGRVIGKGGSSIKNVRQASGARIDVDDRKAKNEECVVTVTSTESVDDAKSAAIEAVLLLQEKINDEDDEKVKIRLLVPSKAIGCLIGKGGVIINEIRKTTKADIWISRGEKPKYAADNEELVEVSGDVPNLRDALLQIVIRLRDDVLRNRDSKDASLNASSTDPLYSSSLSLPPVLSGAAPVSSLGYEQRVEAGSGLGPFSGGSLYGYSSLQSMDSSYKSLPSYSSTPYGHAPPYEMVIPANSVGKILGKGGANLTNIQKLSGATIEIVESKLSTSELVAQISGTTEQKRMAENMIQAFVMS